jgi:hypothetical protein
VETTTDAKEAGGSDKIVPDEAVAKHGEVPPRKIMTMQKVVITLF